ncbi:MAG: hypothetical protein K6U89_07460 [Chloroflexi bacterium]|nr:hypothetical protein [Chloroflexota bacterium]
MGARGCFALALAAFAFALTVPAVGGQPAHRQFIPLALNGQRSAPPDIHLDAYPDTPPHADPHSDADPIVTAELPSELSRLLHSTATTRSGLHLTRAARAPWLPGTIPGAAHVPDPDPHRFDCDRDGLGCEPPRR